MERYVNQSIFIFFAFFLISFYFCTCKLLWYRLHRIIWVYFRSYDWRNSALNTRNANMILSYFFYIQNSETTKFQFKMQTEELLDWIFEDPLFCVALMAISLSLFFTWNEPEISISILLSDFDVVVVVVAVSHSHSVNNVLSVIDLGQAVFRFHFLWNSNKMFP